MDWGTDQSAALAAFDEWVAGDETFFALLGYAGTGKTTVSNEMRGRMGRGSGWFPHETAIVAPSHKAINVVRRMMRERGEGNYEVGFDSFLHKPGAVVTSTTQSALGMRPVIKEEETGEGQRAFGKVEKGFVEKMDGLRWLIIDEVSMLSWADLKSLRDICEDKGVRVLLIGDPGQLPPVKAKEIKWDKLRNKHWLREIMRQAGDSAIPLLGEALREEGDRWQEVRGAGITWTRDIRNAHMDELTPITDMDERGDTVFIAYRNATVGQVNEAACQKLYGHGADMFEAGQIVIAGGAFFVGSGKRKTALASNQERLRVLEFSGEMGAWGQLVQLQRESGVTFDAEYLTPEEIGNPNHPWRAAVDEARAKALRLQRDWKKDRDNESLNSERRDAWSDFYELKDQVVISFRHPYAMTSHRAQGSTYERAFVLGAEIDQFDRRGLYVAATRPSGDLIISR